MDLWVFLTIILSFLMSFSIGSNDAANGLATSHGSNALSLTKLVVIGAVAEFIGAMFCSDQVASTLSDKIVPDLKYQSAESQKIMMFAVCFSSFFFIMTSTFSKMPISGTHTVIGALLGAGVVQTGAQSLDWGKLGVIIFSWFLSPALSSFCSFCLMIFVSKYTLNTKQQNFRQRLMSLQMLSAVILMIISMIFTQLANVPHKAQIAIIAFILGLILVRLMIALKLAQKSQIKDASIIKYTFFAIFTPWKTEFLEMLCLSLHSNTESQEVERSDQDEKFYYDQLSDLNFKITNKQAPQIDINEKIYFENYIKLESQPNAEHIDLDMSQLSSRRRRELTTKPIKLSDPLLEKYFYKQIMITSEIYRYMQITCAFMVCFAHGSNDVANAISPLIVVMKLDGNPNWISFFIGSVGIAMGLLMLGKRVMATVGKEIVILDFYKGFCAQFATAVCVCIGSSYGLPLSTTHCMIGALAGIYIAGKSQIIKDVYIQKDVKQDLESSRSTKSQSQKDKKLIKGLDSQDESSQMNFGTIKKIMFWCAITIPCSMSFSCFITYIFDQMIN